MTADELYALKNIWATLNCDPDRQTATVAVYLTDTFQLTEQIDKNKKTVNVVGKQLGDEPPNATDIAIA